jgi:hypothetical protein
MTIHLLRVSRLSVSRLIPLPPSVPTSHVTEQIIASLAYVLTGTAIYDWHTGTVHNCLSNVDLHDPSLSTHLIYRITE